MTLITLSGRQGLWCALLVAASFAAAGCKHLEYVSMKPLDDAGFSYTSVNQIQELDPTTEEVAEVAIAAKGGISESACVDLVRIARGQKTHFAQGEAVAGLHRAGIADATILELARLGQIDSWGGEALAIRLTGTSDRVILAVAKRRALGLPVPAGTSLAHLKDSGVSEATLLELLDRGITDSDAESIVWRKNRRWTDEQILRTFPPKP